MNETTSLIPMPRISARALWRSVVAALVLLPALAAGASAPREIDWLQMMPADEVKALENMADSIDHDGGAAEAIFTSERTVAKMDGLRGKLPGYLVPITFNGKREVVDMFMVPYFGACIHMPPPPPNQIVYIKPKKPIKIGELWEAHYAIGTLRVTKTSNQVATAVYTMDLERIERIEE
jgi:uncharacterized protein